MTIIMSVQYLKGVGPKLAKILKKLGVETVEDLIYYFPRDYEDRSHIKPISDLRPANFEIVKGQISQVNPQLTRNRFSVIKVILSDLSGSIQAVWFNQPFLSRLFRKGMRLILSGRVEYSDFDKSLQVIVRDFEVDTGDNIKIVPLYPLTQGLYPKKMRGIIREALDNCLADVVDFLPEDIKRKEGLIDLETAIKTLHFPNSMSDISEARKRLIFDDFFVFQLGLGLCKRKIKREKGIAYQIDQKSLKSFSDTLPFTLTSAQEQVLADILSDMGKPQPMNRLLQGDVGSGKTIVATLAALVAVNNGYQVAFMAPTEILAQQHYTKLTKLLKGSKVTTKLMTSSTKKRTTSSKKDITNLFIGTHRLIQEKVNFDRLGLVIIDEQHRFGVLQRKALVKKGLSPDVLAITATPIPRSMALTLYGDFDRSVIDEMPPGRTPIKTHFVPENRRRSAYEFMRQKVAEGQQVFVVCPLVSESEKIDFNPSTALRIDAEQRRGIKAAMDEAARLQKEIFPEYRVGLLHGRLKGEEKDRIMKQFSQGKIHILVSTTVIEVGIDIPNATVMVIEHAERFGLAQLHQLRGRIGRGSKQSFCFLIAKIASEEAKTRVKAMLDSVDGFYLAEVDLKLRGPGDFYGTRQSGLPNFRVADIIRDEKVLKAARAVAMDLVATDLECACNIWESQRKKIKLT
ncbi:MAG: ATP-dependent DNA helicase RecG [Candidatus Saganbacteria bacterium]|nr:ATP-dependent DNA helicase RecG [Candidatus Saganbacteria bacterium]